MKKKADGWKIAAECAKIGDKIVNTFIAVVIITALLYGGFGLWDTYQIYANAGVDKDILKYKPTLSEDGENPTLSELQAINPDVCAWLTIDNTNIDYPVVCGENNLEYVNKAVDGSFSLSGSVFLDSRNEKDFSDFYSLLYAHHMAGEAMFGVLPDFQEKNFFDTHPTGILFTLEKTYEIEIFACIHTDAYDNVMFNPTSHQRNGEKKKLLKYIRKSSKQYKDLDISINDQIIGLSTCYDATTSGRILVFGKLTERRTEGK